VEFSKTKYFCSVKAIVQARDWEKISAKDISDKGLLSKIYEELLKFSSRKINNPTKNGQST